MTIDGIAYDVKCKIVRTAEVRASDISGPLLDGSYFNDVLGTYMKYDIELPYPLYNQGKYAALYEALTEPVDAHTFILPYNEGEIELTARVESVPDVLEEKDSGRRYWKDTRFSIIANHPSKSMTLGEVLARGRASAPEAGEAYADADNTAY